MATIVSDVERAVSALTYKQRRYGAYWQYYDGQAPLVYSSERLREIFSGLEARFTENWAAVVVDSLLDRLELQTPTVANNDALSATLAQLWADTGLVEDEFNLHEDVAVTGEAFVVAWPNADDGAPEAFRNDARLCHVEYDQANPRTMRYGAKWWTDADRVRLTLYYPDRLEYYAAELTTDATPTAKMFQPDADAGDPVAPNPYGVVPIFHLRSNYRKPVSQLVNVIEIQDAVNKLLADMMVAAEFGAFPQRYVISQIGIKRAGLKGLPSTIWDLPAGDDKGQATLAGQFAATALDNYLQAINKLSADIGIITRTPRHYFFAQGGDPSGEALLAMEAPLNHKTRRLQATLTPTWRNLAAFLLRLHGQAVAPQAIIAAYAPAGTQQPRTEAEIRQMDVASGLPLLTLLRRTGWTEAELAQLAADKAEEGAAQQTQLAAAMVSAQRSFDQNAGDDGETVDLGGGAPVVNQARRNGATVTA